MEVKRFYIQHISIAISLDQIRQLLFVFLINVRSQGLQRISMDKVVSKVFSSEMSSCMLLFDDTDRGNEAFPAISVA